MVILPEDLTSEAVAGASRSKESTYEDRLKSVQDMVAPLIDRAAKSQEFFDTVLEMLPNFLRDLESKRGHTATTSTEIGEVSSHNRAGMKRPHSEITSDASDAK
jgi:hypothetical protein